MQLVQFALLFSSVFAEVVDEFALTAEDQVFWDRFLRSGNDMSVPMCKGYDVGIS